MPRPPLPTPPVTPSRQQPARDYPKSYGPSSSIQNPVISPSRRPVDGHESMQQYYNQFAPPPQQSQSTEQAPWPFNDVPSSSALLGGTGKTSSSALPFPSNPSQTAPRGSTFFVPRGSQRASRRVLVGPRPMMPKFTSRTSYSPPHEAQPLPAGAMRAPPSPSARGGVKGEQHRQTASPSPRGLPPPTQVPLANSSSILVHSGFWQSRSFSSSESLPDTLVCPIAANEKSPLTAQASAETTVLQATGSRFLSSTQGGSHFYGPPGSPSAFGSGAYNHHPDEYTVTPLTPIGVELSRTSPRPAPRSSPNMRGGGGGTVRGGGGGTAGGKKKRISVDMIGRPSEFAHLVHASTADQAEAILHRWGTDGIGKVAPPTWVEPIKAASRARAAAVGVAEVHSNTLNAAGPLRVVNGPPSTSTFSTSTLAESMRAVEDCNDHDGVIYSDLDDFERVNGSAESVLLTKPAVEEREDIELELDPYATVRVTSSRKKSALLLNDGDAARRFDEELEALQEAEEDERGGFNISLPPHFRPSLTTIEKAASAKIYFETHYHAILKLPPPRQVRKAQLEKELARLTGLSEREKGEVRKAWVGSESEYLREMRRKVGEGSFVKLKTIGHGAFGVVSLVREKGSGQVYAMKQLRKADMLKKGQEGHVRAERDLLATASHSTEWTVRLAYSFQDVDHLYLVMSYMQGGDLLTLLIQRDTFPEEMAKFYMAEMVLAVEETHKVLGAIHRDIKPDNFLFDKEGHIAISDFGLATDFHWAHDGAYFEQQRLQLLKKHGIDVLDGHLAPPTARFDQSRGQSGEDDAPKSILTWRDRRRRKIAFSLVGTNNYMDVAVIRGRGYDHSCDWWSLGVIMFEMLYGYPPFISKTRQQTRNKILNWRSHLKFPPKPRVSSEARDLIASLICEREDRLGSRAASSIARPNSVVTHQRSSGFLSRGYAEDDAMHGGAQDIKAHAWFRDVDFVNIRKRQPPFVPQISDELDTKYFDDGIDPNPLAAPDAIPGAPQWDDTNDPMLRDRVHGPQLLEVRKQLAFQGWTFKGQKNKFVIYDPLTGITAGKTDRRPQLPAMAERGRSQFRSEGGSSFGRSLSV